MSAQLLSKEMDKSVAGFDWDDGNTKKCQNHGVSIDVIEDLFRAGKLHVEPDVLNSVVEQRFRAVGKTRRNRAVFLVFTIRDRGGDKFIRPISARYMHKKELDEYEKEIS